MLKWCYSVYCILLLFPCVILLETYYVAYITYPLIPIAAIGVYKTKHVIYQLAALASFITVPTPSPLAYTICIIALNFSRFGHLIRIPSPTLQIIALIITVITHLPTHLFYIHVVVGLLSIPYSAFYKYTHWHKHTQYTALTGCLVVMLTIVESYAHIPYFSIITHYVNAAILSGLWYHACYANPIPTPIILFDTLFYPY